MACYMDSDGGVEYELIAIKKRCNGKILFPVYLTDTVEETDLEVLGKR